MLCLTGTTGKLGSQVLKTILEKKLISPQNLVISTRDDPSDQKFHDLIAKGIIVRKSNYNDPASMERAYAGCKKLFLISSYDIHLDFPRGPVGTGREGQHFKAIDAARKVGIKHIYYTSLAFGDNSEAGVMQAHRRTELYLEKIHKEDPSFTYTIIREGVYTEVWPSFLGHYDIEKDTREEILVTGDGGVRWVEIPDLGFATAFIITSNGYENKTISLSHPKMLTLADIAKIISEVKGKKITVKTVEREVAIKSQVIHACDPLKGNETIIRWWASMDEALPKGETGVGIQDDTLERILKENGRKLRDPEDKIREMLKT